MSLDLYVISKIPVKHVSTGVYVRENGKTFELTAKEVEERWPDQVVPEFETEDNVYWHGNITHNLTDMAEHVLTGKRSLYMLLWRADEVLKRGIPTKKYVEELKRDLEQLKANPVRYKLYNPENGWGTYEQLVSFTEEFIKALEELKCDCTIENDR